MNREPFSSMCPNCGSERLRLGKLVGDLDLGGGFGFRPRHQGLRGWLRRDIRVPREWTACTRCGLLWVLVDPSRLSSREGDEEESEQGDGEEGPARSESPRLLVWNVGCAVPRSVVRLRSQVRWLTRLSIGVLVLPLCGLPVSLRMGWRLWPFGLLLLLLLPFWAAVAVRFLHLRTRARRERFQMCPTCEYSLQGESSGRCPECGTRYHSAELPIVWSRALRMRNATTVE